MVSKIKTAIKDFLAFLRPVDESEIVDETQQFSKSKTPARSINVALNSLWKKGDVVKYFVDDKGNLVKMALDEKNSLPKVYKLVKKMYRRKEISIDIYCGKGMDRKGTENEHHIKLWTFEANEENREEELKEELVKLLSLEFDTCYSPSQNKEEYAGDLQPEDITAYAYDDSQDFPEEEAGVIYPDTDHEYDWSWMLSVKNVVVKIIIQKIDHLVVGGVVI